MTETVCTPPYPLWKKIGVESIATYVNFTFQYLALGIFGGSAITAAVIVAFIQGMAIFTTNSLFYMSGPHMNPLLTFSAALFRTSPRVKGWGILLDIIFQLGFAVLAGWTAEWLLNALGPLYISAVPILNPGISQGMGFFVIALFSMIELLAFLIIAKSFVEKKFSNTPPLTLGFLHFVCVAITFQFNRGVLDPLLHFGIAIIHPSIGFHSSSWIYYIGPLAGWVASIIVYSIFFRLPKQTTL